MSEFLFLKQMLTESGWVPAAYLVGLFLALLYRPDRIRLPSVFRWACVLFAMSIMVTPVSMALLGLSGSSGLFGPARSGRMGPIGALGNWETVLPLVNAAGPALMAVSVLLALIAISPGPAAFRPGAYGPAAPAAQPPRHPLE